MGGKLLWTGFEGRISRWTYCWTMAACCAAFTAAFVGVEALAGHAWTLALYPPFYWCVLALSAKRYHDVGRSALWLALLGVPLLGVLWVGCELLIRAGFDGENRYGPPPPVPVNDYFEVS